MKNRNKKKLMKVKKKKSKVEKHGDSGVWFVNNEKKTVASKKKKKKKKNVFNNRPTGNKVCGLCLIKYKLIFRYLLCVSAICSKFLTDKYTNSWNLRIKYYPTL